MSMFLTGEELTLLTGKKRRSAQATALNMMGIEHRIRPDGMPIVSRSHVETMLDGSLKTGLESKQQTQPDWGAMYNA